MPRKMEVKAAFEDLLHVPVTTHSVWSERLEIDFFL